MDFKNRLIFQINTLRVRLLINDQVRRIFQQLCVLFLIAAGIWLAGPLLRWNGVPILAPATKKMSLIAIVFLLWLLKYLIMDMDAPTPFASNDPHLKKALFELRQRLAGFMKFLSGTVITRENRTIRLRQLPWYLLIGPGNAGKSSLLAESDSHFILRKQPRGTTEPGHTIDWWVTRHSCLIDVPGYYLKVAPQNSMMWRFLLHLIRCWRGKHGINGIMIALPLPALLKQYDKQYQPLIDSLCLRINELKKIFPDPVPCQIIITKCDLLDGFIESFSESSIEDINHAWGISLPPLTHSKDSLDYFNQRFDALIKRLNEQLLSRLYHEYDHKAKSLIKEFPLRVENLRHYLAILIEKFNTNKLTISNIFLTSSQQQAPHETIESGTTAHELVSSAEQAIQLIHKVPASSQPYFTKQLIEQTIVKPASSRKIIGRPANIYHYFAGVCGIALLSLASIFIHHDFEQSNRYLQALNIMVTNHELLIQQTSNADERLEQTIDLLNQLQTAVSLQTPAGRWSLAPHFYINTTQHNAAILYQQALSGLFINELANYLGNYLSLPINRETENVYTALKAYLMLGYPDHMQLNFLIATLRQTLPRSFNIKQQNQLINYVYLAFAQKWTPAILNQKRIQSTRHYLYSIPMDKLGYIILKNSADNNSKQTISFEATASSPTLVSRQDNIQIPVMFTARAFPFIYRKEIQTAANEITHGNWILGVPPRTASEAETNTLIQQLETKYVTNYVSIWENLLSTIHPANPDNLTQMNALITQFISNDSPLLKLLQTLHTNTYFDPIASNSLKLYNLGLLTEKTQASKRQLYQIFFGLSNIHRYLSYIESSPDKNKAAFELLAARVKNPNAANPITQLKLVASTQPEPLKSWLNNIADETLRLLMQQGNKYIDLSWQQQVNPAYQTYIANRYPFSNTSKTEVDTTNFALFFGSPGIVMNFYRHYLMPFVDTSKPEWRWKQVDGKPLPFSAEALREIQLATRIHQIFFPNNDNKLFVQFTLQPYKVDNVFQQIKLSINDKVFVNDASSAGQTHQFSWPANNHANQTIIQLAMADNKMIQQSYPGTWGWFKLINQSYDSMINKKEMVINLSKNQDAAKYIVHVNGTINPFLSLNLNYFHLPEHLS